ncbi:hypothetical protein ABEB36_007942 [Hypothenemus hampei]|uniref:Fork-head domain-containing protein n=1 Tax=Hypothenemus hampei TaxID=57062 RepID=A0ABD1EVM8_HYPHA
MSTAMDMFLNMSDSLPFPDILDIDIKSDMDSLVGGHNDFSGFNFNSIEPLELDDSPTKWFNSNSNHSIFDLSGEDGPTMVNPNAVLPVMTFTSSIGRSPSPALRESHLTFSPASIKITAPVKGSTSVVKKDLIHRLEGIDSMEKKSASDTLTKSVPKVTPILAKPSNIKTIAIRARQNNQPQTFLIKNTIGQVGGTPIITQMGTIQTLPTTVLSQAFPQKQLTIEGTMDAPDFRTYPKPAYSYSCLIAMALKNSRTGSLPVSEIYGFMCKHFPYFKTAPNGWKNSVRHNLSLNKCFEKIEKPTLNGAQRKGCLWAMNPAKINKMDEEVQKWSRKDPNAIKKAMVNPENLEALERGELKFSCSYDDEEGEQFGDSCCSVESGEGSDSELDMPTDEIENEEAEVDVGEIRYVEIKDDEMPVYEDIVNDVEHEKELLQIEMALAQKELDYGKSVISNKRRRTYVIKH